MQPPANLSKLSPLVDVVFRRLFNKPSLLASLLNAILDLPPDERLTQLTIQPSQVAGPLADDKEVVLDIRATTSKGRQLHIEVQIRAFVGYVERILYYCSGMYHGQLQAGKVYKELQPVISVHILGFRLLPAEERFRHWHHAFELLERRTHYRLTDHLQIHTIEMPKFLLAQGELSTDEAKWLYYLQHGHEMTRAQIKALEMPAIEQADKELEMISQDRELRVQYEQRLKAQMDAEAIKHYEEDWKEEFERRGHKKGWDEGKNEGKNEGKAEAVLTVLQVRGVTISDSLRQRILEEKDPGLLDRWLARAVQATTADEVITDS